MTEGTWEEAAQAAMDLVPDGLSLENGNDTQLDEIDFYLARLRERPDAGVASKSDWFQYIADDALQAYVALTTSFLQDGRERAEALVLSTIISKQHDYGHDNILWGGLDGLIVRMHDKTARIRNLIGRGVEGHNESLADSWLDVVGYALIGIMLVEGTFERQLAADLITDAPIVDEVLEYALSNAEGDDIGSYKTINWMSDSPLVNALLDAASDEDLGLVAERDDETLWHLDLDHQHLIVGTYMDGWSDGCSRALIGIDSKQFPDPDGSRCAYFTASQLEETVRYLSQVRDLLVVWELTDMVGNDVIVAPSAEVA